MNLNVKTSTLEIENQIEKKYQYKIIINVQSIDYDSVYKLKFYIKK